jgi:predicted transcriptional regulator
MMEITEKAIKQHLSGSDKKNTKDNFVEERQEKIEQDVEIVENDNEETLRIDEKDEEVEEELDEFELRLRRLGKL